EARGYVCENTIVGSDPSLNYFGSMWLKVGAQGGYVAQSSYSSIGYIGPAATGLSLAKQSDQRVVVFTGDGGFQMSAQCLSTQARYKLNPIIFVVNNGVYGVEQWLANAGVFQVHNGDKSSDKEKAVTSPDDPTGFSPSCLLRRWEYGPLQDVFGKDCRT